MPRLILLALLCLAVLGCFSVVRFIFEPGVAALPAPASLVSAPLAKGDRLPSGVLRQTGLEGNRLTDDTLRQAGLEALKRSSAPQAIPEPAASNAVPEPKSEAAVTVTPKAAPPPDEIVSWHWRQGSKVVRRRQQSQ